MDPSLSDIALGTKSPGGEKASTFAKMISHKKSCVLNRMWFSFEACQSGKHHTAFVLVDLYSRREPSLGDLEGGREGRGAVMFACVHAFADRFLSNVV